MVQQETASQQSILMALLLVAVGGVLIFAAAYYTRFFGNDGMPFTDDLKPETVVTEFGDRMKQVSLLAPEADVAVSMDEHYAKFVHPETLAAWKADPANAPGRLTSSPWPDHIEIATSTRISDTEYRVDGVVVELTSDTALYGGQTTGYPVSVGLVWHDQQWMIRTFEHATPPQVSGEVPVAPSYSGTYVCLPHKDQSGPQTLECAFGIHLDDGSHYGLDFSAFSSAQGMTVATGERIRIEGTLVSGDQWNIYDIRGVIRVANITRL